MKKVEKMEINTKNKYIQGAKRIAEISEEKKVDLFVACEMWEDETGYQDDRENTEFLRTFWGRRAPMSLREYIKML